MTMKEEGKEVAMTVKEERKEVTMTVKEEKVEAISPVTIMEKEVAMVAKEEEVEAVSPMTIIEQEEEVAMIVTEEKEEVAMIVKEEKEGLEQNMIFNVIQYKDPCFIMYWWIGVDAVTRKITREKKIQQNSKGFFIRTVPCPSQQSR